MLRLTLDKMNMSVENSSYYLISLEMRVEYCWF